MSRHQIILALQMLLLASFLMVSTLAGSSAGAGDPCDGKAPVVKHGYLEPTQEDDGISNRPKRTTVLTQNVVGLFRLFDDETRWDEFYLRFDEIDLTQELERLLANIRTGWPEMAEVRARGHWNPGTLVLDLEPSLLQAVVNSLADEGASAPLCTGHAAFDALNQTLSLRGVMAYPRINTILISFDPRNDLVRTALQYEAREGVKNARPDAPVGDGSGIHALWSDDKWYLVFRKAWGDCPSGCIHSELHYFIEHSLKVSRVSHEDAAAIPEFAEILAAHGWTQRGAGAHSGGGSPSKDVRKP